MLESFRPFDPEPAVRLAKLHDDLPSPFECELHGLRITVTRGTFCPDLTNTTPFFLRALDQFDFTGPVLDVFAGSGILGMKLATRGLHVTTVEMSQAACSDLVDNVALNELTDRVVVRCLDARDIPTSLGIRFMTVLANPPLLPGHPTSAIEAALYDPYYSATFAVLDMLPALLAPGGVALLLTSDVFRRYGLDLDRLAECRGMTSDAVDAIDVGYETYTLNMLRHAS